MPNRLCTLLDIDFPLMAFSHCRDVVAAVSRAGGFGVLGASTFSPAQLERELSWIDANVGGRPYGVDILMPENMAVSGPNTSAAELARRIPDTIWTFARTLLAAHDVPVDGFGRDDPAISDELLSILPEIGAELLDVAFRHPIGLIANALGVPPRSMLERAKERGIPVAALVGAKEHAVRQAEAGVDIIVAQGSEAGGHCGEVSTLVLVPEVVEALRPHSDTLVVAAGGIVTGRQMAACMALGAAGVWTGSVWLATSEAEISSVVQQRLIMASSRDTVRSRSRTGKPARQLRSAWTDAWDAPDAPSPMPMPFQQLISLPAFERIDKAASTGKEGPAALSSYFVGQGVGLIDAIRPSRLVVQDFMTGFADALEDIQMSSEPEPDAPADESRIPVIVGVGEVNDRPTGESDGLDSFGLMVAALREAERDAGVSIGGKLDWLGVVDQISFPDPLMPQRLADALRCKPDHLIMTPGPNGDGPIMLLNEAANLIGSGKIEIAALVGGEAMRTAQKRAQQSGSVGSPASSDLLAAMTMPMWREFGLVSPADVYPLYENAGRADRGQSLIDAQAESAKIWAGMSQAAADHPGAWLRDAKQPADILAVGPQNRMISFPYTKLMVANNAVNQGAALLVMSLAAARRLGIPEERFVYVGAGAAAQEPADFLARDQYVKSASLTASIEECLKFNALTPSQIDLVEFYSCFPCVPKMIRGVLDWPIDAPHSAYGGLTFGGGPIANCMTHAAAAMVSKLRAGAQVGLIVANGGYATYNHSIVLTRRKPRVTLFPQDYNVESVAAALRGPLPPIATDYLGPATIETYSVPFDRSGQPARAVIIARTPDGSRVLAEVTSDDGDMLRFLTDGVLEPVGTVGHIAREAGRAIWRQTR